jgi:hypothetical protein
VSPTIEPTWIPLAGAASAISASILQRMRILMHFGRALVLLLAVAGVARADAPKKPAKPANPDALDISEVRTELLVLTDGQGHYIAIHPKIGNDHFYYSDDGKSFYVQRTIGGGSDGSKGYLSRNFWAPRADQRAMGEIEVTNNTDWNLKCGPREAKLTQLPAAKAQKMIDGGTFLKSRWRHRAYALARDDHGVYYYVDCLRDEYGGKGFRLWVGQRGAMKQQKMINIVNDSEGDIFATKTGDLRMILNRNEAAWVKGKKRTGLTYVPVENNVYMIYSELGVYFESLGTPCDDI